jgi:hypothetical protein
MMEGIDFFALPVGGFGLAGLSLTALLLTNRSACVCAGLLGRRRAYFRFLYPVMLMNSSGIADFSFRPAFR